MMETKLKSNSKNLGTIKAGARGKTFFEFNQQVEISKLTSSCGCSTPTYNEELNRVEVTFMPGAIPYHLVNQGYYTTKKFITIYFTDGTFEKASITAKIIK